MDRDLHPPIGGTAIPPQPLRPAPQPRPIARPRPSPLQAPNASEILRMQDIGPAPLTPPPQSLSSHVDGLRGGNVGAAFVFPVNDDLTRSYNSSYKSSKISGDEINYEYQQQSVKIGSESSQKNSFLFENKSDTIYPCDSYRAQIEPYENSKVKNEMENFSATGFGIRYPVISGPETAERISYNSPRQTNLRTNNVQGSYGLPGSPGGSSTAQTIMESIYGPQAASKMLQAAQNSTEIISAQNQLKDGIEMTPFRVQHTAEVGAGGLGKQNVSQIVQTNQTALYSIYAAQNSVPINQQEHKTIPQNQSKARGAGAITISQVPPPAPPDPSNEGNNAVLRKNGPTTGERIFNALRSVTSQSYIDASEFYK